jgi:S1-C subfamily serine protease
VRRRSRDASLRNDGFTIEAFGLDVWVGNVRQDSPAARGGLKRGDVILELGGASVTSLTVSGLSTAIGNVAPDVALPLAVKRGAETLQLRLHP